MKGEAPPSSSWNPCIHHRKVGGLKIRNLPEVIRGFRSLLPQNLTRPGRAGVPDQNSHKRSLSTASTGHLITFLCCPIDVQQHQSVLSVSGWCVHECCPNDIWTARPVIVHVACERAVFAWCNKGFVWRRAGALQSHVWDHEPPRTTPGHHLWADGAVETRWGLRSTTGALGLAPDAWDTSGRGLRCSHEATFDSSVPLHSRFRALLTFTSLAIGLEGEAHGAAAPDPRGRVLTCPVTATVVDGAGLCTQQDRDIQRRAEAVIKSCTPGAGARRTTETRRGCSDSCSVTGGGAGSSSWRSYIPKYGTLGNLITTQGTKPWPETNEEEHFSPKVRPDSVTNSETGHPE